MYATYIKCTSRGDGETIAVSQIEKNESIPIKLLEDSVPSSLAYITQHHNINKAN